MSRSYINVNTSLAIPMPYEPAGPPRNMIENQNTVRPGLGAHTSDPLLKVVEWIAWLTETFPIIIGYVLLLLLLILLAFHGFGSFLFLPLAGGVVMSLDLYFLWVIPSRQLRLGIQQLSALKFVPWMLTAFIHSVLPAYFFWRTNSPPWRRENYWAFWVIVWTLILTLQVLVLAAVIRVRRLKNERKRIESANLLTEPEVGASQNVGTPTTTSPQPDVPSRSPYACLSVEIPETSHLSDDDLEDFPPSYSALESSVSTSPPSYSTLKVNQDAPEFFKT